MSEMLPYISEAFVSSHFGFSTFTEEKDDGTKIQRMLLEGEFQRSNTQNKNKRVYSRNLLARETQVLQETIKQRGGIPMGMDHPLPGDDSQAMHLIQRIGMENACALNNHLEMNGDIVYGKAVVLEDDGSTGTKLASMVRRGFKPGVSSRGIGGKPYEENGMIMVPEDYKMITYDFVTNPSTHNAILDKYEESQNALLEQALKETQTNLWQVMINLEK